ncbi:hypothetical protein BS629_18690 [Rhizobium leguminosarum bv. viciae USDA 2370]|nr:hypothetical protein BS629_18690 [Rhizobium leguminosarum bv. viciae USDA 2370]
MPQLFALEQNSDFWPIQPIIILFWQRAMLKAESWATSCRKKGQDLDHARRRLRSAARGNGPSLPHGRRIDQHWADRYG